MKATQHENPLNHAGCPKRVRLFAKETPSSGSERRTCSQSVIGYRLEDGTDKMECYFLPGRPQQKTLDMVAEQLKAGWILTEVIRPANADGDARRETHPNQLGG